MIADMRESITIVIPTYKRPDRLVGCLDSALAQTVPGHDLRVLVVDNDADCSAREVAQTRADYVCEPASGVSNARNRAIAELTEHSDPSRYVFFLDDDMIAAPGCIARLLEVMTRYEAGVAFAAVEALMPTGAEHSEQMQPFFSRRPCIPEGPTDDCMGAGGSLFDLSRCPLPDPVFDPSCNQTGGEDDLLLSQLLRNGVGFVWVPSAMTHEIVPAHRATLSYLWTRNVAFGQGPTQMAADELERGGGMRARLAILRWMLIGMVQFALRLPVWLITKGLRMESHATAHAKLAQAVGKVLWWDSFRKTLYGASAQPVPLSADHPVKA